MTRYNVFRLKNHALLMALAAVYPLTVSAAGAAKVDFAVGSVNVVTASGAQRPAAKGTELQSGDTLITGNGGRAQLRFSDGGMVSLQPGSEYRIDDYRFSGSQDGSEKGVFSLVKGGLRTITGQVGRNNKAAYRVNTSVATIGIRGTEFTIVYTGANSISLATGEGAIEVCNNAGCVVMPSGTSAIVSGPDTRIERSEVRPRLDPAQPEDTLLATFSSSDGRQEDGRIAPVSTPMTSGGSYAVAYAATSGGTTQSESLTSASGTFDSVSLLQSFSGVTNAMPALTNSLTASQVAGGFTVDGLMGWGRWTRGAGTEGNTAVNVQHMHYVVAAPTSLAGLTGMLSFQSFGGTNATHLENGVLTVGGVASGSLTVNFLSTPSVSVSLNIPIAGSSYNLNLSGIAVDVNKGTFKGAGTGGSVAGIFTGANATYAGLTYRTENGVINSLANPIAGAVVFGRSN